MDPVARFAFKATATTITIVLLGIAGLMGSAENRPYDYPTGLVVSLAAATSILVWCAYVLRAQGQPWRTARWPVFGAVATLAAFLAVGVQ